MTTDTLKKQAREHEQNEAWDKALVLYRRALEAMDQAGEPEISLFNRVADLELRVGNVEAAMEQYERAIDLYLDSDLPNNAIAICRKILRNVPGRAETFLRMGEIRARQGFGVDARQNVLTYAEMMEERGDSEAATAALEELVVLFPADVDARVFLGERLVGLGQQEAGVAHLLGAWQRMMRDASPEASALETRILELDPGATFPSPGALEADQVPSTEEANPWGMTDLSGDVLSGDTLSGDLGGGDGAVERFLDFSSTSDEDDEEDGATGAAAPGAAEVVDGFSFGEIEIAPEDGAEEADVADDAEARDPEEGARDFGDFGSFGDVGSLDRGGAPSMQDEVGDRDEAEAEEAGGVIPGFDLEDAFGDEDDGDDASPLPFLDAEDGAPLPGFDEPSDPAVDSPMSVAALEAVLAENPNRIDMHYALVDRAHEAGDRLLLLRALVGLAGALDRGGKSAEARATWEQVLQLDARNGAALEALDRSAPAPGGAPASASASTLAPPPPPAPAKEPPAADGFVDLGALVLDEEEAPTTRWVVDDERSGNEDADFAQMLSKFKAKVAQHITRDDARASYDLGTAYREMGLMDEAIGMFQQALRAQPDHMASLEMLGQCFLDRSEPKVAIRVLSRALEAGAAVEDDLIGIYYFIGVAHEDAGNRDEAREFYEKVFSLDINFKDVTDRLRALR